MSYSVYQVKIAGNSSSHVAVYVETGEQNAGEMMHVRCAVGKTNMVFERLSMSPGPASFPTFQDQDYMGTVKKAKVDHLESVCNSVPAPAKQFIGNSKTCECNTWIGKVWTALKADGVLEA